MHLRRFTFYRAIFVSGKASSLPDQSFVLDQSLFKHQVLQPRSSNKLAQEDSKIRELGDPSRDWLGLRGERRGAKVASKGPMVAETFRMKNIGLLN